MHAVSVFHMAPHTVLLQNYWENPHMRATHVREHEPEEALLGTPTAPFNTILEDFVTFKHPTSYLQPEKHMQTTD